MTKILKIRFSEHKHAAKVRKIEFLLTFEEWLKIWIDSGYLHQRGCHKGEYVMARIADDGPYAVGNVEIITVEENLSRGNFGKEVSDETRRKIGITKIGNTNNTGRKLSKEQTERIRIRMQANPPFKGKKHSDETLAIMREKASKRKKDEYGRFI